MSGINRSRITASGSLSFEQRQRLGAAGSLANINPRLIEEVAEDVAGNFIVVNEENLPGARCSK